MTHCCPDLEKLIHPSEAGIGVIRVTNRKGSRFILECRKDRLLRLEFKYNSALSAGLSCDRPDLTLHTLLSD